jgi:hypothetical protein
MIVPTVPEGRIVRSFHDPAEFLQVFKRMAGYYPGSAPLHPRSRTRAPEP